jgi:hypothetical protein
MNLGQRVKAYFFGEPKAQEFSSTPMVDYMTAETYGTELLPMVTRNEALSIPEVMRARNMICSLATLPIKTYDKDWKQLDNPLFRQIDPTRANVATLADTLEDLLFYGYAYWRVTDRLSTGYPAYAEYVPFDHVSEQIEAGRRVIRINGDVVPWADVLKFESPNPGFLKHGGRVVRRALDLDVTAAKFAKNPRPLDYFTPDMDVDPLDDNGIRSFLQKWKLWLRTNVTGYVPAGMKYVSVDQPTPAELQINESKRQVGLSIANMTGIDPEDLGISTTTRTYQNATDRRQDRINEVFAPYMRAITDRLTMGDVTKRGHQVFFDLSDYMKADETTRANVQIARKNAGLLTDEEIRADEHRPALPASAKPELEAPKEEPNEDSRV